MHLEVAVHRLLADAAGLPANDVEAVAQLGDRTLEAALDGGEVPLIVEDQRRFGFDGETVGQGECAVGQGLLLVLNAASSGMQELGRSVCGSEGALPQGPLSRIF
ncbi:hypothetical protein [Agromyces subbeticus]|uniref:hypothetical protein n=1 Tax=Agromyces subbeticus TaxID=293890 RepID=UPI0003B76984|nr:hypothetical protein [Agromyces subbeticus]